MPRPRAVPVRFTPVGCSDAPDGTNAPPGAMAQLANLVPDPAMNRCFVPRPAATLLADLSSGIPNGGFISGLLIVGDVAYGMISSSLTVGFDQPFAYNLATKTLLGVTGVTATNVPASPATSGFWTPPILAFVANRVIVTHTGFNVTGAKFGWFDISGASIATTGSMTNGSATIAGNPSILGVQPGMTITGTSIAAGATVVSTTNFVLTESGTTHGTTTLDGLASTDGIAIGQQVAGVGIKAATTVTAVGTGSVTLSQAATGSGVVSVTFTGTTIVMSANATGTTSNAITIAGGTTSAPLWGAGDCDRNNLPSVPIGVAQFNGRAWFALGGNGIVFSDAGLPCRVSNTTAVQALTTSDGIPVTAVAPLMLSSPLVTTGIVQSLLAFQGTSKIQQITGDLATTNLAMNAMPVATGTAAPLSIVSCEAGTAFISPEGLRIAKFDGTITDPIGYAGTGITQPFIFAVDPSRICGAAARQTLRFTTQDGSVSGQAAQEWWYDLTRRVWVGPMNFPASLIQLWQGNGKENTFIMAPQSSLASLWQSDPAPSATSVFTENGKAMSWAYQPSPLPDTGQAAMNALLEMSISAELLQGNAITVNAFDITGLGLDQTTIPVVPPGASLWGQFNWGAADWGALSVDFQQWPVYWHKVLVFKQLVLLFTGASVYGIRLSNLNMKYERLGYQLPVPKVAA